MKRLFFILSVIMIGVTSCTLGEQEELKEPDASMIDSENPAKIEFYETTYDFGKLVEGDTVHHTYRFKNVGESPLIIVDAKSSCGCTVPTIPENPISPGEEGEIEVVFNSQYKPNGPIKKTIRVSANTAPSTVTKIELVGEIVAPE